MHPSNLAGSFRTVLEIDPDRPVNDECIGYALSLFDSLEKAKARLEALRLQHPRILKKVGNSIAEGTLDSSHGVAAHHCHKSGHFSFFEAADVELFQSFAVVWSCES